MFWLCDDTSKLKVVLPANWTGLCASVRLIRQITVIEASSKPPPKAWNKRGLNSAWDKGVKEDITWNQEPSGVPDEYTAISEACIQSGQGTGWVPVVGLIMNSQYTARNSRWINLLCFNQQRFMNWTLDAMTEVSEKLHATSLMAVQNRVTLEALLAPEQGVCTKVGEECCMVIPMHTGKEGNLTKLLTSPQR